jgi:hypothetical protein
LKWNMSHQKKTQIPDQEFHWIPIPKTIYIIEFMLRNLRQKSRVGV